MMKLKLILIILMHSLLLGKLAAQSSTPVKRIDEKQKTAHDLKTDTVMLKEVTVVARKQFLEQKADKLVVNVEGSPAAAGSSTLEILKKVPGVIIRNEQVTMAGKPNVNILINGKSSPYTDINQLLATTAASNIEKIELISNPGARYDAAGGAIINIILKKNANMGTNGTISLAGAMGIYKKTRHPSTKIFIASYPMSPSITERENQCIRKCQSLSQKPVQL